MESTKGIQWKSIFSAFGVPILLVLILVLVKFIEEQTQYDFGQFGVLPRKLKGLRGIFLSTFIHGSWNHLFNNSIPLVFLGASLFHFYKEIAFKVLFWSYILPAAYTWISARHAYHIGASGLVYALFGFLLISGFLRKHKALVSISFLVAFFYGSMIWGILPWEEKISWEGHFWGLAVGIGFATYYRKTGLQDVVYEWEEEIEDTQEGISNYNNTTSEQFEVVYHIKEEEKEET